MTSPDQLTIEHHGAALYPGAALSILPELEALVAALPADHAGLRLHGIAGLGPLLAIASPLGRITADRLGEASRPVRAILFDKSAATNWALGWHQDRTIALRVHLDPVPENNAPLLIAPGSHRLGRTAERDLAASVTRCGTFACTAQRGDVWLYATPILHASARAARPEHRRVLQVDFTAQQLPPGLDWLGI